jgi:hypothetical protein
MSDRSANLSLPYIQPSQAQKHVTHNEALERLDALVQLSVLSATEDEPPAQPEEGDRYLLPAGASGAWSGRDGDLAVFANGAWLFLEPQAGWLTWVRDLSHALRHDGTNWVPAQGDLQNLPWIGVNATADATNRLSLSAHASLFSHDGAGHQVKVNKTGSADTASLLFQTGFSGRAEMGTMGSDGFSVKVSSDGASFRTALIADPDTGVVDFPNGASGLTDPAFGAEQLVTRAYLTAGHDLVTNGMDSLGTGYNYPAALTRDPAVSPGLPAAFSHAGYHAGPVEMVETIPVDPNHCYRLQAYLRQDGLPGDWSAHAEEERHEQSVGIQCIDPDGLVIEGRHHVRFHDGGTDSLTVLSAPLSPGDTEIHLADASGWNDSVTDVEALGVLIFGYTSASGRRHDHYSRIVGHDLFDPAGVNKTTHVITLSSPLPASLGNPGDGGGTWPAGTAIANTAPDTGAKRSLADRVHLAETDRWYQLSAHVGGVDLSGTDVAGNFAPGTVGIRVVFWPNISNLPGGSAGHPDTGADHRVHIAGVSLRAQPLAVVERATGGSALVHVPVPDVVGGVVAMAPDALIVKEI